MVDPPDSNRLLSLAAHTIERRDAELLLAWCWRKTRAQLLASAGEPVPAEVAADFERACLQRAAGVPVAYLLGRREFWSMEFAVSPAVLVPRPETELLVQRLLQLVTAPAAQVADLGTGSGAIAIALATERPNWHVTGTDASPEALAVARENGTRLAGGRVEWKLGNWYAAVEGRRFDALGSNPPYIAADDPVLESDGLRHEPRRALTPGGDGTAPSPLLLMRHRGICTRAAGWPWNMATLRVKRCVSLLVARGFTHVTSHRDLAGHERVTEGKAP